MGSYRVEVADVNSSLWSLRPRGSERLSKPDSLEIQLLGVLESRVSRDDFYTIGEIVEWWKTVNAAAYINPSFVGRRLRKLGFREGRKVSGGHQIRLTPARVEASKRFLFTLK